MTEIEMENRLKKTFSKAQVAVFDLTGTGSNFEIRISNEDNFQGLSRVQKHQKVMAVFDEELKSGQVHALSVKILET